MCEPCRESRRAAKRARHGERRAAGLCVKCATLATSGKAYCDACVKAKYRRQKRDPEARREADRRRYAKRRARCDCTTCGKPANGTVECKACCDAARERYHARGPPGSASSAKPRYSAAQILAALPRIEGSPWVIPGRNPVKQLADLNHYWDRAREEADLEGVRIHDLRYSFASLALALGESLSMIGKPLGHDKIDTNARYARLARDSIKASSARVAGSIGADILNDDKRDGAALA